MIDLVLCLLQTGAPAPTSAQPQLGASPPAVEAPPARGWELVDGVAHIVNKDMFRWSDLTRQVRAYRRSIEVTTREELDQLVEQVVFDLINSRLQTQAGEAMGLDPEMLESNVQSVLDRQQEEKGVIGQAEYIQAQGFNRSEERQAMRGQLQRALWYNSVTGKGPGAKGRPTQDTFLRPGQLFGFYSESPEMLSPPERAELQFLVLLGAASGGLDEARILGEELRVRAEAGEGFGDLVYEYGAFRRESQGRVSLPVQAFADEEVRKFAGTAGSGAISEVLPYTQEGVQTGWQILRLNERIPAPPPPPFTDGETQAKVAQIAERQLGNLVLQRASMDLHQKSYLWVHPQLQ